MVWSHLMFRSKEDGRGSGKRSWRKFNEGLVWHAWKEKHPTMYKGCLEKRKGWSNCMSAPHWSSSGSSHAISFWSIPSHSMHFNFDQNTSHVASYASVVIQEGYTSRPYSCSITWCQPDKKFCMREIPAGRQKVSVFWVKHLSFQSCLLSCRRPMSEHR